MQSLFFDVSNPASILFTYSWSWLHCDNRDAIVNWVKKRVVGLETLGSLDDLERSKERSEVFLVGFFDRDEVGSYIMFNLTHIFQGLLLEEIHHFLFLVH